MSSLLPVFVTQENVYQFLRERYMKPDVTYFAAHDFISSLNETYQLNRVRALRVCFSYSSKRSSPFQGLDGDLQPESLVGAGTVRAMFTCICLDRVAVHTSADWQPGRRYLPLHSPHW